MNESKIAIIGGGAAGLMAAARIVELGGKGRGGEIGLRPIEVFLVERNKILGQKVIISGGGRCNVTTGLKDLKELMKKYPRGSRFLRTALYHFPPGEMIRWMETHGVPLKTEEDLRVFPKSDNGKDVVRAFENFLRESGVHLLLNTALKKIEKRPDGDGGGFTLHFENREPLHVDKVILTPGGQAYRHTGSKGDGYSFAESLGHSVTPLGPSLNAFVLADEWTRELAGLSFKEVELSFRGKEKFSFLGPVLFTHKGITGPAVFALSAYASYETFDRQNPAGLFIDFFPDKNNEQLSSMLRTELNANPKKSFKNVLAFFVPRSFSEALCLKLQIDGNKWCAELAKKDFNKIIDALKHLPLSIVGRSAGDEFVTAGGIELSEVDSKTMESKICPGLYFAGEILDYDGFTGGYNLQAAWSTGRLAGESAST